MSHADDVRTYCGQKYIDPARLAGKTTIEIRSGDVHGAMNYKNRYPLLCSAIGAQIFESKYHLRRLAVDGPLNGANTLFRFQLL